MTEIQGKTVVLGDDIHANQIIPVKRCTTTDEAELGNYCFENESSQPELQGKILVAGDHFGTESVRDHAVLALKGAGVKAIIAESFASAFFRNAINSGLPVFQSEAAASAIETGAEISIDTKAKQIKNSTTGKEYTFTDVPEFVARIRDAGGIQASFQSLIQKES